VNYVAEAPKYFLHKEETLRDEAGVTAGLHTHCHAGLKDGGEIREAIRTFNRSLRSFYMDGILQPWVVEMYLNAISTSKALVAMAEEDGLYTMDRGEKR